MRVDLQVLNRGLSSINSYTEVQHGRKSLPQSVCNVCCGSSSYGLSLKNQKPRTYLGQLLGICQIVHGDSQEDVQERICWGAAKEKPSHSKYSKRFLFCYHYPSFPIPAMVYYG